MMELKHDPDEQVVKPVVSVYPAASRAHLEGRSSLLCLASAMFPPLVQFSWKRQKEGGPLEELPPAEGEQLELTERGAPPPSCWLIGAPSTHINTTATSNTRGARGSPGSSPASVQGEAALSALHSADSEESALLLWTPSADEPQKQGTSESTAVEQTLHYQHCVEQTEQLHPALRPERIQGNHCNREGVKEKP
ncbi:hypothetical protein INR49_016382, partial [Caranx melampygus]